MFATKTLLSVLLGAVSVAAHGHVNDIVVDGAFYQGYDVTSFPYMSDPPVVVGWATGATDNGFVAPDAFQSADIICHRDAENAGGFATVAAGSSIMLEWDTWPESHHGPVIDYLASCGSSSCTAADKTSLEFFKIQESGLIDGSAPPGIWASDTLIDNGNRWVVNIPSSLAPGNYVLRHEIIALHSAGNADGAQNYPQCVNIQVTGSGTDNPSGVLGTELYQADDAGILVNIYQTLSTYDIPGPSLYTGAEVASQTVMEVTGTSSATVDGAAATGGVEASSTSAAEATTTTAEAETTSTTEAETSEPVSTTAAAETSTLSTSTTTAAADEAETTSSTLPTETVDLTTTAALSTITTEASVSDAVSTATPISDVFTRTRVPCGSKNHRRHARHVIV